MQEKMSKEEYSEYLSKKESMSVQTKDKFVNDLFPLQKDGMVLVDEYSIEFENNGNYIEGSSFGAPD